MGNWFHRNYDRMMGPLEKRVLGAMRRRLLSVAEGEVLELGAGTGANFAYYRSASRVTATEPETAMLAQAEIRAREAAVPVRLVQADATRLPFPDASFDTVVGTLVFCTIPDPAAALAEAWRVVKPGGKLLLLEHVRLRHPLLAKLQDWLTPAWMAVCDGCRLNRRTAELVHRTGFETLEEEERVGGLFVAVRAARPQHRSTSSTAT
ncbi:SAM-dependent methyltransferase [Paenibacillus sp. J31TS4]|uniref:class I SAM-dependent methyltransferase n=1 Tax=Paenibacillus sp. J31TS4 TaxID=2807195 RepID=UPI001B177302|nr:class I SAM-dependent methyltransferase [Paenibacillus sp. J31TS4]GIP37820.1 SAM-dependent methyltransferase [Paenibacillus sp. J31TS4]